MKNIFYLLLVLLIFSNGLANDTVKTDSLIVQAVRTHEKVIVDGILSETVWQNGNEVSKFTQREPIEGSQATEKTEVRIAYDDNALYIGARMFDSAPDSIIARLARRDAMVSSDYFAFFIDPYYDKRSGFYFVVTAAGTLMDGVLMNDDWDDDSWDGVWEVKTNIDDKGWTAEFSIPYSQLRFHKKDKYIWGVNFKRKILRKNESDYLTFTPKDGSGFVSRFVDLIGIENISPIRQIEFLPYFRTKAEYTHPEAGNPFNDGSHYLPGMGLDVKLGIGNNLTLDATVNPDFGQVEVDPAVVNLSDIETYFMEKRPFFIEGSNIFRFGKGGSNSFYSLSWGGPRFFHSRRIGRTPQGSLPDFDFADMPEGTKILGAGKLTGKTGNNWNLGVLGAVTAREKAELQYSENKFHSEVEPLTYYGVFRTQKEFEKGRHGLGFISTLVNRKFDDVSLKDQLNSESYGLGLDGWTFFDKDKVWVITGWAGLSQVRGNQERMTSLQQSSRHYFQRPDVSHVQVDSLATSMTG
ncbi:carbohydrate binding family 9 domain-containing protein [candidate division KSB1 bacterium]|nr:carbohydrate binding family 9 domain-containing protein [candidate division KSB1 bacterium]